MEPGTPILFTPSHQLSILVHNFSKICPNLIDGSLLKVDSFLFKKNDKFSNINLNNKECLLCLGFTILRPLRGDLDENMFQDVRPIEKSCRGRK